jgi:alkylhydroperoxidase/carboxymuconolactone decarboxylase family protein YurZ
LIQKKKDLDPERMNAWENFSNVIFREGALSVKTKELIAIASGHITLMSVLHQSAYN